MSEEIMEYNSPNTPAALPNMPSVGVMAHMDNINQGTVAIEASRAIAEAQGKLVIAKRFPRNEIAAYAKAMEAFRNAKSIVRNAKSTNHNVYSCTIIPEGGGYLSTISGSMTDAPVADFGNTAEGQYFVNNTSQRNKWLGYQTYLDSNMQSKQENYALVYYQRFSKANAYLVMTVNMSVAETALEALSIFDAAGYGLIGGLFSCIYSVGRLVNGRIGDKTPPWIMLTIGLGVAGLANITIGFLPPYLAILLLWCTNAYAQSMLWSSVLAVVSSIYRGPYLKRMTSLMVTAVATGNIVAVLLGGFLITYLGVSFAFVIPGALNIILGVFVFFATRKVHPEDEVEDKSSHASMLSLKKP